MGIMLWLVLTVCAIMVIPAVCMCIAGVINVFGGAPLEDDDEADA